MDRPEHLILQFQDGSREEIEFNKLSKQTQEDLLESCTSLKFAEPDVTKSYVLLKWQNGWQEVIGIKKDNVELMRFYIIERTEKIGRMSMTAGENYPLLFYVRRLPMEVESALFTDSSGAKIYNFTKKTTIKQGETTEHMLYDSKNPEFTTDNSRQAEEFLKEMANSANQELEKKGFTIGKVLSMSPDGKNSVYLQIAGSLGIRAMNAGDDIYGFIELLLKKIQDRQNQL